MLILIQNNISQEFLLILKKIYCISDFVLINIKFLIQRLSE